MKGLRRLDKISVKGRSVLFKNKFWQKIIALSILIALLSSVCLIPLNLRAEEIVSSTSEPDASSEETVIQPSEALEQNVEVNEPEASMHEAEAESSGGTINLPSGASEEGSAVQSAEPGSGADNADNPEPAMIPYTLKGGNPLTGPLPLDNGTFKYEIQDDGTVKIISFSDNYSPGNELTIPEKINDKEVTCIGEKAFLSKGLIKVIIGQNVKRIESSAFADNGLTEVSFNTQLEKIGPYAFNNNLLTSDIKLNNGQTLENGYYEGNASTMVLPDTVTDIGAGAFSANRLSYLRLPNSISSLAENAFDNNGHLVVIYSENANIPPCKISGPGSGFVQQPYKIQVCEKDSVTGGQLGEIYTLGDYTDAAAIEVFSLKERAIVKPREHAGYTKPADIELQGLTASNLTCGTYLLTIPYQPENTKGFAKIEFTAGPYNIPKGTTGDALISILKGFVKSFSGPEDEFIDSDKLTVDYKDLKTDVPNTSYTVTYKISDPRIVRDTQKDLVVNVVEKWQHNGWEADDFIYEDQVLTGFSVKGLEKLNNTNEPTSREVCLPPYSSTHVTITEIKENAFIDKPIINLDLSQMSGLVSIGNRAFYQDSQSVLKKIKFGTLNSLEIIGDEAFGTGNSASVPTDERTELDISGLVNLKTIGNRAFTGIAATRVDFFSNRKIETLGDSLFYTYTVNGENRPVIGHFSDLNSVVTIGKETFAHCSFELATVLFRYMGKVTSIGERAFYDAQIEKLSLSSDGGSKLSSIGAGAFAKNNCRQLVLSDLKELQTIGQEAFAEAGIEFLTIKNLGKLRSCGSRVFADNLIPQTPFDALPELTDLPGDSFAGNPGLYDGRVLILYTPKDQVKLTDKETYVVNRTGSSTGTYTEADFIYDTVMDEGQEKVRLCGFSPSGYAKLTAGEKRVVLQCKDKGPALIKEGAFEGLNEADFVFDELKECLSKIGARAFKGTRIESFDFKQYTKLTEIADEAFAESNIRIADFSGLVNLTQLGKGVFKNTPLHTLILQNTNLTAVPAEMCLNCPLENVTLAQLHINEIGDNAFESETQHDRLPILNLTELGSLTKIGTSSFRNFGIRYLDLTTLGHLTSIGEHAFADNHMVILKLPIQTDFTNIPDEAFARNLLRDVDLPDNIKTISDEAFWGNGKPVLPVILHTSSNPHNIPDAVQAGKGGHVINGWRVYEAFRRDSQSGPELRLPEELVIAEKETSALLPAPEISGYVTPENQTVNKSDTNHNIVFVYKLNGSITLDETYLAYAYHKNEGPNRVLVGNTLLTNLNIGLSGSSSSGTPESITLIAKIKFAPQYLDQGKTMVDPASINAGVKAQFDFTNGELNIEFTAKGGDIVSIPIKWVYKSGSTPMNYMQELPTKLFLKQVAEDKLIADCFSGKDSTTYATIGVLTRTPLLRKGTPITDGENVKWPGYVDTLRDFGKQKSVRLGNEVINYVYEPKDIPFEFYIGQTDADLAIDREIGHAFVMDTLPQYRAYEAGKIVTKTAVFEQDKNPGWKLCNDDNGKVCYEASYDPGTRSIVDIPRLLLSFPGIIEEDTIVNHVEVDLTPYHMDASIEQKIHLSDELEITVIPQKKSLPGDVCYVTKTAVKRIFFDKLWDDTQNAQQKADALVKDGEWPWEIHAGIREAENMKFKKLVVIDDRLDPRMYFSKVKLQNEDNEATVKGYAADGKTVLFEKTFKGQLEITAEEANKVRILEVSFPGEVPNPYSFHIYTKLCKPAEVFFDRINVKNNIFKNYVHSKGELEQMHESGELSISPFETPRDVDLTTMLPIELSAEPEIRAVNYPTSDTGRSADRGTEGGFTLHVLRTGNHKAADTLGSVNPINNFEMICVLPSGFKLSGVGDIIKCSTEFEAGDNSHFEIVNDYNGSGRTAVIFTADKLPGNISEVAEIKTIIEQGASSGTKEADLYMAFKQNFEDGNCYSYGAKVVKEQDGKAYMRSSVRITLDSKDAMEARKLISKDLGETWSYEIETSPGETFYYQLRLHNAKDDNKTGTHVIDVLPAYGDKLIQVNQAGFRMERRSEFANILKNIQILKISSNNAASADVTKDYKIKYTKTDIKLPNDGTGEMYLLDPKHVTWSEDKPDAGVTAFWIQPGKDPEKCVLKKGETLLINVEMQAPKPEDAQALASYAGKRAYNSFIRKDDSTDYFLETNLVCNKLRVPGATIRLTKIDEDGQRKMKNVEFKLYHQESGKLIAEQFSNDEGVVEFSNIPIDNYFILEIAPAGYLSHPIIYVKKTDFEWNNNAFICDAGEIKNTKTFEGKVSLDKIIKRPNESIYTPKSGVEFTLYKVKSPDDMTPVPNFTPLRGETDEFGHLEFTGLQRGAYRLVETKAPMGYSPVERRFELNSSKPEINYTGENSISNEMYKIYLYKLGLFSSEQEFKELSQYTGAEGQIQTGDYAFKVINKQDSQEKVTVNAKNNQSYWEITGLKPGTQYAVTETRTPENSIFNRNKNEYIFKLNEKGELIDEKEKPFQTPYILFPNMPKQVKIALRLQKVYEGQDVNHMPSLLKDIEVKLYRADDKWQKQGDPIATEKTDKNGQVIIKKLNSDEFLSVGKYLIEETPPPGYVLKEIKPKPPLPIPQRGFEITEADLSRKAQPGDLIEGEFIFREFKLVNVPIKVKVIKQESVGSTTDEAAASNLVSKLNEGKNPPVYMKRQNGDRWEIYRPLKGVEFSLYDDTLQDLNKTFTSDQNGEVDLSSFTFSLNKTYILKETKHSPGSWIEPLPSLIIRLTQEAILGDGSEISYQMYNRQAKGQIIVYKFDRYTGTVLTTAEFTLYRKNNDAEEFVSKQKTENGYAVFTNLDFGDYVLKETLVPEGYKKMADVNVSINENMTSHIISAYNQKDGDTFSISADKLWLGGNNDNRKVIWKLTWKQDGRDHILETHTAAQEPWNCTFKDLLKSDVSNVPIVYTLEEECSDGWEKECLSYEFYYDNTESCIKVRAQGKEARQPFDLVLPATLQFKNRKTIKLLLKKSWQDHHSDNRPQKITVTLFQNGKAYEKYKEVVIKPKNGIWEYVFDELPECDWKGIPYTYTIFEQPMIAYVAVQSEKQGGTTADGTQVDRTITMTNKDRTTKLDAVKLLENKELKSGEFTFRLWPADSEGKKQGAYLQTVQNGILNDSSAITFEEVPLPQLPGEENALFYIIDEVPGTENNIEYDSAAFLAKVWIEQGANTTAEPLIRVEYKALIKNAGSGELEKQEMTGLPTFKNKYRELVHWQPKVQKTLIGRELKAQEFTFSLSENGREIQRVVNQKDGSVLFNQLSYTAEDEGRLFRYTIREMNDAKPGIQYDAKEICIELTVKRNEEGQLVTAIHAPESLSFENHYMTSAQWTPKVSKKLIGERLQEGQFSFALYGPDGTRLQVKKNDASGDVFFDALYFGPEDIGKTYQYTIHEIPYTEDDPWGTQYHYDTRVITVKVTVNELPDGAVEVSAQYSEGQLFINERETTVTTVPPETTPSTEPTLPDNTVHKIPHTGETSSGLLVPAILTVLLMMLGTALIVLKRLN